MQSPYTRVAYSLTLRTYGWISSKNSGYFVKRTFMNHAGFLLCSWMWKSTVLQIYCLYDNVQSVYSWAWKAHNSWFKTDYIYFSTKSIAKKSTVVNCCVTLRFSADMLARISGLGFIVPEISLQITRKICGVNTLCWDYVKMCVGKIAEDANQLFFCLPMCARTPCSGLGMTSHVTSSSQSPSGEHLPRVEPRVHRTSIQPSRGMNFKTIESYPPRSLGPSESIDVTKTVPCDGVVQS